jgi:tetratricopeptide (TPR) repeat protein
MIALWLWASVDAHAGKTTKIEKALAAWEAGDAEAWDDARAALDKASAKAPDDPALLVVAGRLWLSAVTHGRPVEGADPVEQALSSFEGAQRAGVEGELRAQVEPAVAQLASVLVAELTNQVEGKQWDDARAGVTRCARAFALAEALGQRDAERTGAFERLATRVAVQAGDLAGAKEHFGKLHDATGTWDAALAAKVARKVSELGAPAESLVFLGPILDAQPTEEALLRVWVELALQSGAPDQAVARLDAVREQLVTSKSGAVLLGELYDTAGRKDEARAAYEALLAQEPTNIPANAALARFWLASARATRTQLDAETAARKPTKELKQLQARINADLQQADDRARKAVEVDPGDAAHQQLLLDILTERIAAAGAVARTSTEKAAVHALEERRSAVVAKLAELGTQEGP